MARKSNSRSSQKVKKKSHNILQPARLDAGKLKQLYSTMLRCRMLTEKLQALEQHGNLDRNSAPEAGQEAIEAGALVDLQLHDLVAPGLHSVPARLVGGEPVKSIVAELLGTKRTPKKNRAVLSILPCNIAPAAQINIALGAALASKTHGDGRVAFSLCREASTSPSVWRDAVIFSALNKLAVVHVVQTSRSDGTDATGHSGLLQHLGAASSDLPIFTVDSDDVVAVYRVAQEAVRRARQGRGPALIECQTSAQSAPGLPANHSSNHQRRWNDPIIRLEAYLRQKGFWSERWKRGLVTSFARELDRAVETPEKSRVRLLPSDRAATGSVLASAG